jgi:hypothetical protein
MIDLARDTVREFYVEPGGKRWLLACDRRTGRPYVVHQPGQGRLKIELDLGSFLVLFQGRERDGLLKLIASLLPDDFATAHDRSDGAGAARQVSRGRSSHQV